MRVVACQWTGQRRARAEGCYRSNHTRRPQRPRRLTIQFQLYSTLCAQQRFGRGRRGSQLRIDQREQSLRLVKRLGTIRAGARVLPSLPQLAFAMSQSDEGQRLLADVFAGLHAAWSSSNNGASSSRNFSYPRNARSFTAPSLVPSTVAISANVICSKRWR